jgi:capsular exopolysaccharide synthesis family protein
LSSVLLGRTPVAEALHPVQLESAFLHFMPTGPLPPNPAELLASARAQQVLEDLKLAFDAIIIDTPPLNLVTDAAIIGARADGVLVLARAGVTDRDAYRYAIEQLQGVHARVLGCVLNDVDTRAEGQYGRDGSAYYAPRAAT